MQDNTCNLALLHFLHILCSKRKDFCRSSGVIWTFCPRLSSASHRYWCNKGRHNKSDRTNGARFLTAQIKYRCHGNLTAVPQKAAKSSAAKMSIYCVAVLAAGHFTLLSFRVSLWNCCGSINPPLFSPECCHTNNIVYTN